MFFHANLRRRTVAFFAVGGMTMGVCLTPATFASASVCCTCSAPSDHETISGVCLTIDGAQLESESDCSSLPKKAGLEEGWTCANNPLSSSECRVVPEGMCAADPIAASAFVPGDTAEAEAIQKDVPILPNLNVPIPGFELPSDPGLLFGSYMVAIYRYGISIASVAATAMFIWGAFIYLIGSAGISSIQKGKEIMTDSVIGMILVFSAHLILRTLNPELAIFKSLSVTELESRMWSGYATPSGLIVERDTLGQVRFTPVLGKPRGNTCILNTFGSSNGAIGARIKDVTFLGDRYKIHELAARDFQAAFTELEAAPKGSPAGAWVEKMKRMPPYHGSCGKKSGYPDSGSRTGGSYIPRLDARLASARNGKTPCLTCDLHALGLAIDLDSCYNPMCPKGTVCRLTDPKQNRIPKDVVEIFARHHVYWGGYGWKAAGTDWNALVTRRDPMHFEWHGICWK